MGKPMAMLLLHQNGTVTICHSRTKDLPAVTSQADILVSAVGKSRLVTDVYKRQGLLFAVLFDPLKDSQGLFPANGFQQERRQLLEMLDAEFNDKVGYAHQRCEEILFHGQNDGVGRCEMCIRDSLSDRATNAVRGLGCCHHPHGPCLCGREKPAWL